jgi:nicotinamidase/pyrazinamidase
MADEALIIVDVQNDFCPGGALAVPDGDAVVPVLNQYARRFVERGALIIATRDWHPAETRHFKDFGGVWPVHCVQGTIGAELHPSLRLPASTKVVDKGADPNEDAYSGFQAKTAEGVSLPDVLRRHSVQHVYVGGLATDYCVKATALDALNAGFRVTLLLDAMRGVNLRPHDAEVAIEEMVRRGAEVTTLERVR